MSGDNLFDSLSAFLRHLFQVEVSLLRRRGSRLAVRSLLQTASLELEIHISNKAECNPPREGDTLKEDRVPLKEIASLRPLGPMPVLLICNPASGDRTAPAFLERYVLPLLDRHSVAYEVHNTEAAGHAGRIAQEFVHTHAATKEPFTIIIGGGDGTTHEVVNGLVYGSPERTRANRHDVHFILLPLGTANALYYSLFPPSTEPSFSAALLGNPPPDSDVLPKLQSLFAFLSPAHVANIRALTLSETTFSGPSNQEHPDPIISSVVTSTSLHAAILDTAEQLRDSFKGTERFKEAAKRNITNWYNARVTLLPSSETGVQMYDVKTDTFTEVDAGACTLEGPFAYFLSTINVDRLESAFVITPLSKTKRAPPHTMELLVIRPRRDPSFVSSSSGAGAAFAEKTMKAMQGAYSDGSHVRLRYSHDGTVGFTEDGPSFVEYYRCRGWEWKPEPSDDAAHLVCADGTILSIPVQGKASSEVLARSEEGGTFAVWA